MSERQAIGKDFGEGKYIKFEDGVTRTVLITNWGAEQGETKFKENGKEVIKTVELFCADVLNADGKAYNPGEKCIESASICFKISIKPFILEAQNKGETTLHLRISRKGVANDTTYFIEKIIK